MNRSGNLWSIVLAGGEGSRLRRLTTGPDGRAVPKQYCSVNGGSSLIQQAVQRAASVAGLDRTIVIVAAEHRSWWSTELVDLPTENVVVQPCNRGTACGVMLPLMQVLLRDPDATVVVLPSDHVVADEAALRSAVTTATEHAVREPGRLVLLGIRAERPDTGLGWISTSPETVDPVRRVIRFVEKPSQDLAEELVREGALWNSFIFAIRASALFGLFQFALPWMTRMFTYALSDGDSELRPERVGRLYDRLPNVDFSRAILQEAGEHMAVVSVPPCGWTDVGTPDAVALCAATIPGEEMVAADAPRPPLDLVDALRAYQEDAARATAPLLKAGG